MLARRFNPSETDGVPVAFEHPSGAENTNRNPPTDRPESLLTAMLHLRVVLAALACLALVAAVRGDDGGCGEGQYKNGQKWTTGPPDAQCAQYTCKDGIVKAKLCSPVYAPSSKCKVKKAEAGAVYPNCCPTIECP